MMVVKCRWCNGIIPWGIAHRNGVCVPCMKKHNEKEAAKKRKKTGASQ